MKASILLFGLLFWSACRSPQYSPDNLPPLQLRWGSGGGFTGREQTYVLLESGQIFWQEQINAPLKALSTINSKDSRSFFTKADKIRLDSYTFDHPGNLYQFVEIMEGDQIHRIVWGNPEKQIDPGILAFYESLNRLIVPGETITD